MIPAILSCVFVLYLYRTLNAPEGDLDNAAEADSPTAEAVAEISDKLSELNQRLNRILARTSLENKQ